MKVTPFTAEDEYIKNPDLKKEDIELLQEWVQSQPNIPKMPERMLILFLHSCYYDMESTKACIEVFYNIRSRAPEFFLNRDITTNPQLKKSTEALFYSVLPVKDPNGHRIICHGLLQYEPSKYIFSDGVKLLTMASEACLYVEGTIPGYTFLFDMKGVRLGHLTRLNLSLVRKFFMYIQEGIPLRLKAIHVVNTLPLIDKVMFLLKPFLKKELLSLIHFHSSDYSEIQKHIPKSCLPSDYGGDLPCLKELNEQYLEWLNKLSDYFRIEDYAELEQKFQQASLTEEVSLRNLEFD